MTVDKNTQEGIAQFCLNGGTVLLEPIFEEVVEEFKVNSEGGSEEVFRTVCRKEGAEMAFDRVMDLLSFYAEQHNG